MISTTTHRTDSLGNPVSGSAEAVARYDAAIGRLLGYHNDVVDAMTALATDEPDFAMGQVLAAYLSLTSTDVPDLAGVRQIAAGLGRLAVNDREAAHRAAVQTWLAGDWHGAARLLDELLVRWPSDLLALLVGHQLDFFLGDAANLRDRVARSLPTIDPAHPHHGYVRGMFAFGLEESGHYDLAEHHGMGAVERHADDVWATHAVAHVYEMQGRVADGIRFLQDRQADWGDGNLFNVHNWWHVALYLLEAGRVEDALAVYDRRIHHQRSAGVPLEMIDASALLWRLYLDGVDTGGRFAPLAEAWATRTADHPWYVFNDLHAVMALAGADRRAEARAVVQRLEQYVSGARSQSSNVRMTVDVGLPACRAVLAYTEHRDDAVIAALLPIRSILARFGGSHAQRDALQRTLVVSAIRSGQLDLAGALVNERLAVRETSVWSWLRRADVLRAAGDTDTAGRAEQHAAHHATRFAAAAS